MVQAAASDLGMDQAEFRRMNLVKRRRLPAPHAVGLPDRLRPVRQVPRPGPRSHRLRGLPAREGRGPQAGAAAGHRHLHHDRAAGRGQQPRVRHLGHQDVRLRRAEGPHDRQGAAAHRRQDPGPGPRDHLGADRRARAGHSRRGRAGGGGRHRHCPVRHGHLRLAQHARGRVRRCRWCRGRSGPRPARSRRTCSRCPRRTSNGSWGGSRCAAPPTVA